MTLARQILPGTTYLVTRRVARRRMLLTPSPVVNELMRYCFARAAAVYGVQLHALQLLGDHYHAVLSDPDGRLPEFMAWVDRESAKALNGMHGREGNLWSSDHYSAVRLRDRETVLSKLLYVFANVVEAGLVMEVEQWPGVTSLPADWLAGPVSVPRPRCHFSQRDPGWAEAELRFSVPPQFADVETAEFVREVEGALAEKVEGIRRERRRRGAGYLGARRVLDTDPFSAPRTPHVKGRLNPTFAAATAEGQRRARAERRHFLSAYAEARDAWRAGLAYLFPAGTYWLARFAGVACADATTACVSVDTG